MTISYGQKHYKWDKWGTEVVKERNRYFESNVSIGSRTSFSVSDDILFPFSLFPMQGGNLLSLHIILHYVLNIKSFSQAR